MPNPSPRTLPRPPANRPLEIRIRRVADLVVLELAGEFDGVGAAALGDIVDALVHEQGHVTLDLGDVTFMGAQGVEEVLRARRLIAGARRDFTLSNLGPAACRALAHADLDGEIDVLR